MEDERGGACGDCAFCSGREAGHRNASAAENPQPRPEVDEGAVGWWETDFALWEQGRRLGLKEPGGVPWYAQDGPSK